METITFEDYQKTNRIPFKREGVELFRKPTMKEYEKSMEALGMNPTY